MYLTYLQTMSHVLYKYLVCFFCNHRRRQGHDFFFQSFFEKSIAKMSRYSWVVNHFLKKKKRLIETFLSLPILILYLEFLFFLSFNFSLPWRSSKRVECNFRWFVKWHRVFFIIRKFRFQLKTSRKRNVMDTSFTKLSYTILLGRGFTTRFLSEKIRFSYSRKERISFRFVRHGPRIYGNWFTTDLPRNKSTTEL